MKQVVTLDLASIVTSVSGPKRPHDRIAVKDVQTDFQTCLTNKVSIRGPFVIFEKSVELLGCATNKAQ